MMAVVLKKPIPKEKKIGVHGAESFNGIVGDVVLACCSDGADDRILMYINAATDGVGDFHKYPSLKQNRSGAHNAIQVIT
jgi:hypothetical protein